MSEKVERYKMYINGNWVDAVSGKTFESINPFTGSKWAEVPRGDKEDVDRAVKAARDAFESGDWSKMSATERGKLLHKLGVLIKEHATELAMVETRDNGKLIREMLGQMNILPEWYYYFGGLADKIQGDVIPVEKSNMFNFTLREPMGVVGAITAWNSPLLLASMKMAPALAAGNTFILKPSENTPVSSLEFAKLVEEAGFPPGVVNVVTGFGKEAGAALVNHPDVDKLAFTGSTETGISIARSAAANVTRLSLELGGKSPNIVFEDAELDNATNGIIAGIFAATGQTCIAGSRLLVHESVYDKLLERLVERANSIKLGDPSVMETEMGPVAFKSQLEKIEKYVQIGIDEGATLVCGGKQPSDPNLTSGFFFEPTIFTNVTNDMRIAQEEIFGPVLCVMKFNSEDEAIELANNTKYGLAAGVWTKDFRKAYRVSRRIKAGTVWINAYRTISYASPISGYKMSGYGIENGIDAIKEYTQVKSIWVELSGKVRDPFKLG